jgi:hypothetical protein
MIEIQTYFLYKKNIFVETIMSQYSQQYKAISIQFSNLSKYIKNSDKIQFHCEVMVQSLNEIEIRKKSALYYKPLPGF